MVGERSSRRTAPEPRWLAAAREVLGRVDRRAITILAERIFPADREIPTLQDLGDRFHLSRERVRQLEAAAVKELRRGLANDPELSSAVSRVRDQGLVFPARDLESILGVAWDGPGISLEVQLLLFLAGPYQLTDDTFVASAFQTALGEAVGHVAQGPVPLAVIRKGMTRLGIREDQQVPALRARPDIRITGEMVIPWSGSIGDKAAMVLALEQSPMTPEEIHEQINEGSLTTLKNYLGGEARFQRRGPRRWGLAEWGGESYKSIAAEMADELRGLPHGMPIERLKRILDEKFAVVGASVEIMSVTHPSFVREGSWVRLRDDDEPYVPDAALEEARDCVVIRGSWAWRHVVTHDTLRGSGQIIPEAFAALLRLFPKGGFDLPSDFGAIPLYWPSQSPGIGSLRRVAESLGAVEGDLLFVIFNDDGRLHFNLIRRSDMSAADGARALLLRLGQSEDDGTWLRACAAAVGLPSHAHVDEVEQLLEARGDREVLRLFGVARRNARTNRS